MKSPRTVALPALVVLSATLFVTSPSPQMAAEAPCGPNNGNLCWSNESCVSLLFYKQCTTKYKYYPGQQETVE